MFWTALTRILLRNRFAWLVTVAFATAFMAYQGTSVEMTYEFAKLMTMLGAIDPVLHK